MAISNSIPKSILLQLGAKYYGIHLGPTTVPQEESDPRIDIEPNFYYPQEDMLKSFSAKNGISCVTTRPSWIPGAVPDAAMNLCLPLAIYATIQKHLGRKLEFPSDLASWELHQTVSSAQMNGYLSEWAVLSKTVENGDSFNAADDSAFTWAKFWPRFAAYFGLPWTGPETENENVYHEQTMGYNPPPRGYGPPGKARYRFTLAGWAKNPEVQDAWKKIASKHDLREKELRDVDRIFGFADGALLRSFPVYYRCVLFSLWFLRC